MPKLSNLYSLVNGLIHVDVSTQTYPEAVMLIDPADWSYLQSLGIGRVCAFKSGSIVYAKVYLDGRLRLAHRLLLPGTKEIDHRDGNGLNNLRSNLRAVTSRQNHQNRHDTMTSQHPGVYWYTRYGKWKAQIRIHGKKKHLGYFTDELEAAQVYIDAVHALGERMVNESSGYDTGR